MDGFTDSTAANMASLGSSIPMARAMSMAASDRLPDLPGRCDDLDGRGDECVAIGVETTATQGKRTVFRVLARDGDRGRHFTIDDDRLVIIGLDGADMSPGAGQPGSYFFASPELLASARQWSETSLRPAIPTTMSPTKKKRANVAGSLKMRIPIANVPTAPMPVQTA